MQALLYDPAAFPGAGYWTAGGSGPVYYYATAAFARPLAAVSDWSLFSVSRGFGAIWLAGLMMVIYLLAERLGASRLAGVGVAVLVGTGSATITSAATMGPDTATAVASGGNCSRPCRTTARVVGRRGSYWPWRSRP